MRIIEPAPFVVKAFDANTASIDMRIRSNVAETSTLAALRNMLLPNFISGELRIPEARKLMGEDRVRHR